MKRQEKSPYLVLTFIGGTIPGALLLGNYYHIAQRFIILYVIVATLVLGATALWVHAAAYADGSEWWQDDDPSGWRGY